MYQNKFYLKELVITTVLTALVGEIYLYPLNIGFRFTAGVVIVSFLLLYFSFVPEIVLLTVTGVGVFIFRVMIGFLLEGYSIKMLINLHYPAFFYYFFYGVFLKLFNVRTKIKSPLNFIIAMSLSDMGANFAELAIRYKFNFTFYKNIFISTFGVALIRSISAFSLYWLLERHRLIIQTEEHQKRYIQLLHLVSELKAEFFYMKKSSEYLERAMKEGYEIYQILKEQDLDIKLKKRALNLTKDIHEIKKDFLRITSGIRALLPKEENYGMSIKSITDIIKGNTHRILKEIKEEAKIEVTVKDNYIVLNYFSLFTILNNLVSNSIGAIGDSGLINISVKSEENCIVFLVEDDGAGINPKDLPYIFEPGFSTKFTKDGKLSTGVGLTHVKALVKELKGTVKVNSKMGKGTIFEVRIPICGNFQECV